MKDRLFDRRHERVALALQGGGALGAYEAGVYEALAELGYAPDWLVGVSIGALNAAIIAGNRPSGGWSACASSGISFRPISARCPPRLPGRGGPPISREARCAPRSTACRAFSRPASARSSRSTTPPRCTIRWSGSSTSTASMRAKPACRCGAVDMATGDSTYFDSQHRPIRAEHIVASCALPPGLPPVEVDGAFYWDGAIVTNTPMQYVLDDRPRADTLVFQVDLYSARGVLPVDLDGVRRRRKEIAYASRTRFDTDSLVTAQRLRQSLDRLIAKLPRKLGRIRTWKRFAAWPTRRRSMSCT